MSTTPINYEVGDEVDYLKDPDPQHVYKIIGKDPNTNRYTLELEGSPDQTVSDVPDGLIRPHVTTPAPAVATAS